MKKGLLIDCDRIVSEWAFKEYNRFPIAVDRAIGIVEDGKIIGAALFTSYNAHNANFSYYGKDTLTAGIARGLAKIALYELNLSRLTVIVPKRPSYLLKKLHKYGFKYEGVQKRFYGPTDRDKHTGCRFVVFREQIEKFARVQLDKAA